MKLKRIPTAASSDSYLHNSNLTAKNCEVFNIPYIDFTRLFFYINTGKNIPITITIEKKVRGSVTTTPLSSTTFVVGKDFKDNYYGVFSGINPNPVTGPFYLLFTIGVTPGPGETDTQLFFITNEYENGPCDISEEIESCYGVNRNDGIADYDINGVYFGVVKPGTLLFGSANVVYKHRIVLKTASVINNRITYASVISNNRVTGTEKTIEGVINSGEEELPFFYYDHAQAVLLRGIITYQNKQYIISDLDFTNDCCKGYFSGKTRETETIEFDCKCFEPEELNCLPPVCGTVTVNNGVATITYTGGTNVEYSLDNGSSWIIAGPSPIVTAQLPANTAYSARLRSNCGNNVVSSFCSIDFNSGDVFGQYILDTNLIDAPTLGLCQSVSVGIYLQNGGTITNAAGCLTGPVGTTGRICVQGGQEINTQQWTGIPASGSTVVVGITREGDQGQPGNCGDANNYRVAFYRNNVFITNVDFLNIVSGTSSVSSAVTLPGPIAPTDQFKAVVSVFV